MRPEIAALVKDTIYDELENAPKVYQYPPVMGVTKNLYFISHSELEKSVSRTNFNMLKVVNVG